VGAVSLPVRLLLGLFVGFAVVGAVGFGLGSGGRAAVSYLAGMTVATAVAGFGAVLVEVAGRIAPAMAMIAAMSNYALTVLVFVLILSSVDSSVVDVPAFALGLLASVVPYLAWQFAKARPGD
jgi:hypothetical protein